MTCSICTKPITQGQPVNQHHDVYKSQGGTDTASSHQECHVRLHSSRGDFREWGKESARTRRWAFNLLNVRSHPAYDFDRAYYLMLYAQ